MSEFKRRLLDIIEETIQHYQNNSRAVIGTSCVYFRKGNGAKCAVGRCLENAEQVQMVAYSAQNGSKASTLRGHVPFSFKSHYRGICEEFWDSLQDIHDDDMCWTCDGESLTLSDAGKIAVTELRSSVVRDSFYPVDDQYWDKY